MSARSLLSRAVPDSLRWAIRRGFTAPRAGMSTSIQDLAVETHNEGGKFRVLVTKNLPGTDWLKVLTAAGAQVDICTAKQTILDNASIIKLLGNKCHGVIGQLTEDWSDELFGALKAAGGKVYSNYAVGYNNIVLEDATKHGIAVGNTPGVLTETTAELAAALTLTASRRVLEADKFMRGGKYEGFLPDLFVGKLLQGKTLGVIGPGRIGFAYAKMMVEGHKMNILYNSHTDQPEVAAYFNKYSDFLESQGEPRLTARQVDLEELLRSSDVVSLHCALTPETRHLINKERLSLMKPDAILVNAARGPNVDEKALVAHLQANPGFSAGLDVYEDEPAMAPGLAECSNAVLMPHIASATLWTRSGMATLAACNVMGVLLGYPALNKPNDVLQFVDAAPDSPPKLAPSILNAKDVGVSVAA